MKKLLAILAMGVMLVAGASATTLAWDPNPPAEEVTQYNIAVSDTVGTYTASFNTAQTTFTLPEGTMTACNVYYLAVQAQNSAGLVSAWTDKNDAGEFLIVDLTDPQICGPSAPTGISVVMTIDPTSGLVTVNVQ